MESELKWSVPDFKVHTPRCTTVLPRTVTAKPGEMIGVCSVTSSSLWPRGLQPARLLCPRDPPGSNARVGCHFLLQRISLTQGSNQQLLYPLHWQVDSLPLSHLSSPKKMWRSGLPFAALSGWLAMFSSKAVDETCCRFRCSVTTENRSARHIILSGSGSQRVAPRPTASVWTENLLYLQILRPHLRLTESETLGVWIFYLALQMSLMPDGAWEPLYSIPRNTKHKRKNDDHNR